MKFLLGLLIILNLSACKENTVEIETPPLTNNTDTTNVSNDSAPAKTELIGFLQAQNVSLTNKATHILLDEFGEIISQLKSSTVDLSVYVGKKVAVNGQIDNSHDIKILTVETISEYQEKPLVVTTDIKSEPIITWQKFKDNEGRFTFSYPDIWQVKVAGRVTYVNQSEINLIKISRLENSKNLALANFVTSSYQEITVNKSPALRSSTEDGFAVYLISVGEVLKIRFYANNTDLEDYFNKFLESFVVSLEASEINEISRCGVSINKICPEGFRCELEKNDIGICVPINAINKPELESLTTETVNNTVLTSNNTASINNENPLEQFTTIPSDVYQNNAMQYELYYPQAWWYKSFGPVDNILWLTEFGKKEIENTGEGGIMVSVKNGARGVIVQEDLLRFTVLLPRDSNSHFEITAGIEYKKEVASMAKTLHNNL